MPPLRRALALAGPLALVALLSLAGSARATVFTVNDVRDRSDLNVQAGGTVDGACDALPESGLQCTLRAAIEEANGTPAADEVRFEFAMAGGLMVLDQARGRANLPLHIRQPLSINGCSNTIGAVKPCFAVRSPARTLDGQGVTALLVEAPDVTVAGLSVTNASQGISVAQTAFAPRFTLHNSYIGLNLDGTILGNETGVSISADDAKLGGSSPGRGNVISGNTVGIRITGADRTVIQGNQIGPIPNTTRFTSFRGIVINGVGANRADQTLIGGPLSAAAQATLACDETCNVIAGEALGVDVGTNSAEPAAAATLIAGNHIGVNRAGDAALAGVTGVSVGDTSAVTIGGSVATRNVIAATGNGIVADGGNAGELWISENRLGTNAAGTERLGTAVGGGIILRSVPAKPATVRGNLVAIGDGYGIQLQGRNAKVLGNQVGIGTSGLALTSFVPGSYGIGAVGTPTIDTRENELSGNVVGNSRGPGILLRGANDNVLVANRIGIGLDGAGHSNTDGILIEGFPGTTVMSRRNVIGGGESSQANLISYNRRSAISVAPGNSQNFFNAFRGERNSEGPDAAGFIDLGLDGPGNAPGGPNGGIQAPEIVFAAFKRVVGTGRPGAVVLLFEKQTDAAGEIDRIALMAPTVVGADGVWSGEVTGGLPGGRIVVATQSLSGSGTSELSEPVAVVDGDQHGIAPETSIAGPVLTNDATPSFEIGSSLPAGGYLCAVDGSAFRGCPVPFEPGPLGEGPHAVAARAIGQDGLIDPTAAEWTVTIDTAAPAAPLITAGPSGATADPAPAFAFSGEPGASFRCAFDGAPAQPCASGHRPAAALAAGPHSFAVFQIDGAGNAGPAATRGFEVQAADGGGRPKGGGKAPQTRIDRAPKRKLRVRRGPAKVSIHFSSDTPGARFLCTVDRRPQRPCASPLRLKLQPGRHRVSVRAVDTGGRVDPSPATTRIDVTR